MGVVVVTGTAGWRDCGVAAPVITIGNFDGVHRGHRALIDATRALAAQLGAPCAVLTFDPAPRDVLRPDNGIARIQSLDRKLSHLARAGLDAAIVQPFDRALAGSSPRDFAQRLADDLDVRGVCVGHDFRFGRGRAGDVNTLRETLGVPVQQIDPLTDGGRALSSSRVRAAIEAGDLVGAAALLGRPHELVGTVVHGDARGRTIGFPTANLVPHGGALPPDGVYAVQVEADGGGRWPGVANLGVRPTFGGAERRLEVHLFGDPGDLYGRVLVVGLVDRVREERRFAGVDALVEQIRLDVARARELLA